jgi:hypothetical protein
MLRYSLTVTASVMSGFAYTSYDATDFNTSLSDASLAAMLDLNVNTIEIMFTWYQEGVNSTLIQVESPYEVLSEGMQPSPYSPTMQSIEHVIDTALSLGLSSSLCNTTCMQELM